MDDFELKLNEIKDSKNYRQIPEITNKEGVYVLCGDKKFLNLSSNDYLNLSTNNELAEEFIEEFSSGSELQFSSASARLLSGTGRIYGELEDILANLFHKESALIFNTGYQCNLGVISTLTGRGDIIFSDKLNHASIIDGMKLSEAEFKRYKHLDYDDLEQQLIKYRNKYNRAIIVSESVFSMDGDIANIKRLSELKNKYDALLMIDEAHAFCTMDDEFAGMSDGLDVDIITATFGKALGSFGAFVVSNKVIINYLINKARSFIFSTSIPPINIAWTKWLITKKIDFLIKQKQKLTRNIIAVHKYLCSIDMNTVSESQIIPIIIGDAERTIYLAEQLKKLGFWTLPIRPPTVAKNTSRLRLSLTADIEFESIRTVIDYLKNEI